VHTRLSGCYLTARVNARLRTLTHALTRAVRTPLHCVYYVVHVLSLSSLALLFPDVARFNYYTLSWLNIFELHSIVNRYVNTTSMAFIPYLCCRHDLRLAVERPTSGHVIVVIYGTYRSAIILLYCDSFCELYFCTRSGCFRAHII